MGDVRAGARGASRLSPRAGVERPEAAGRPGDRMLTRTAIALALIVGTGMYTRGVAAPERPPARLSLAEMPLILDGWRGVEAPPLADDVLAQLGVDDYVNRHYAGAGRGSVSVYVG